MTSAYNAIIVGAGHNGLVASFYLARAGLSVLVVEQRDVVGGACVTEELMEGYRFSTCAGICWKLQSKVIRDMSLERHGFDFRRFDPDPVNVFAVGSCFPLWSDERRAQEALARIAPADAAAFPAWRAFWRRASALTHAFMLREPPTHQELSSHARAVGEAPLLEELQARPLADICQEFFADPRVQGSLVNVDDIGDPWKPGSAWVESYFHQRSELGTGIVIGGMGAITHAMACAASEQGAQIRTGAEVDRILVDVDPACARGVRLRSGKELYSDVVLSNADPKRTYGDLLGSATDSIDVDADVRDLSTGVAYLKLQAVMRRLPDVSRYFGGGSPPRHGQIAVKPSLEHYRRAYTQALAGEPADEPIVYLHLPTVFDPTLTDRDGHSVSAFVRYAPPRLASGTWNARRIEVGEKLIDYVAAYVPNFRDDIVDWLLLTPEDIATRVSLTDGNIHHLDMVPTQPGANTPLAGRGYRTGIEGLYLCGAGTHPGGEVTGAPGHNAAHSVLADIRSLSTASAQTDFRE
ncbi:MAG: phytoene desaturase family protein [Thermoleophilaceae bacterium]